ncbi:MAG: hypothetical protein ACKVQB_12510 [Bacteroidia bacterium]
MKIKLITIALVISSFLIISSECIAQNTLTKPERKALKKEIKAYKKAPETYKAMKDKNAKKIEELEAELEGLRNQLTAEWRKVDSLNAIINEAEKTITEYEKAAVECGKVPSQGTVYSVQIGNYKILDLRTTFNANKGLRTESYTGANAYMIGNFTSLEEAIQFASDIKKLGISDAFVTQYIDGSRIITFDALKGK